MRTFFDKFSRPALTLLLLAGLSTPGAFADLQGQAKKKGVPSLVDEFHGSRIDPANWLVVSGTPSVSNDRLVLSGKPSARAEVQSVQMFRYGLLQLAISSNTWESQSSTTDSSFGFEIWQGKNSQCHYGVILVANGHLGLLRPQPDAGGNCQGDPEFQAYVPISNWDAVRAGEAVRLTLSWAPKSVMLHVSIGNEDNGHAVYLGPAEPSNQMRIRLNADFGETYQIDYVRSVGIPWQ